MASVEKLLWYRNRLTAMSAGEIVHRLGEKMRRFQDQNRSAPPPSDLGALPAIPGLREGLTSWNVPAELAGDWEATLAEAKSGSFHMLGQDWPTVPAAAKWHIDPVTNTPWPDDRYCFDIDFRHARDKGDVKYVWELNRLQYLQPIAALACLRKDAEISRFCFEEIENWIDHNPAYKGVNWASGIELAMRLVSVIFVTSLVGEHATPQQRAKIWSFIATHAHWLQRYPSKHSSANNHRTAEGLGLFIAGALCKPLADAPVWRQDGWAILCDAAERQILPDGAGAEQAIAYTAVVLEMLLLGQHIATAVAIAVPPLYRQRIAAGGEYLRWFTDSEGNQPHIGDDDNARVIGAYQHDEAYIRSVLACIAAITGRGDLTPPNFVPRLRQALFGMPPLLSNPPSGIRIFEQGGYTVGRHDLNGKQMLLAMDHGSLGYLSIAAHGHADALAIWLHLDDQPVLVDAGTYLYHSGGAWRDYFRGTRAHNTLMLEGANSSTMAGNFNWSHKANARLISQEITETDWSIEAEHDGYFKQYGIVHRRKLTVRTSYGFSVMDWLIGGEKNVEIGYLLHPKLNIQSLGTDVLVLSGGRPVLRISYEGPLKTIIEKSEEKSAWYSSTFAEKSPVNRIAFTGKLGSDQKSITHFFFDRA